MHRVRHNRVPLLFALALSLTNVASAQRPHVEPGFEGGLARYQDCIERNAFFYHTEGRVTLAKTRDPRALTQLITDYVKSKTHPDHARYTIAEMIGRNFRTEEFQAAIAALRKKNDKPVDTWLWVRTLRNEIDQIGDEGAVALARDSKKAHLRAAAIAALGASANGNMKSAIVANCISFPKKESERMLLLGAMTGALFEKKRRVNDDDYREALKAYISLLSDDVKLGHTAKVQMSRHLQEILGGPAKFINPEPWLELLERGEVKKPKNYETSAAPRFFGIETEGERFCYVIDMSDSMLKPISPSARPKGGPITGPRKKKKKKSMVLDEGDLPWHDIVTRWDLAREQLRISLSRLSADKYFSVVWFGRDAGTLSSSKGLIKATRSNINKVMEDLDSIKAAPNKMGKMSLRGDTSLHSGIRIAFSLGKRGTHKEPVYVGAKPLTEGCDTIFLLSDGAPTWDGFSATDKNYGEGQVYRDIEDKIKATAERVVKAGPYSGFPTMTGSGQMPRVVDCWLMRDIERMNAFRRITIHCVGLGEANELLLNSLANLGNGQVFIVGKKK